MSHEHPVYDNDGYFVLDPKTKSFDNQSGKTSVIQYDHNSEEIRFKFPKIIEGHDMTKVDLIQIHFDNTSTGTSASLRTTNEAPVDITDTLKECEEDPEYWTCSWLIGEESTQLAGSLKFKLKFVCYGDDNTPVYKMNTLWYTAYQVLESSDSTEGVIEIYPDIITEIDQLKRDVEELKQSGGGVTDEQIAEAVSGYLEENPVKVEGGGLSDTAKNLLLTILRSGVYVTDQSSNIAALETELNTTGGDNSGGSDEETPESGVTQVNNVLYVVSDVTVTQNGSELLVA